MTVHIDYPEGVPWWVQLVISLIFFGGILALVIMSSTWAMNDATRRGKSGCLIGILVFITWPVGLLFWVLARPDLKQPLRPPPVPPS